MNWKPVDDLRECGYYLAKWRYKPRSFLVSELWFDVRNWWSARSYLDGDWYPYGLEMGICMTDKVVSWMEKPKANS